MFKPVQTVWTAGGLDRWGVVWTGLAGPDRVLDRSRPGGGLDRSEGGLDRSDWFRPVLDRSGPGAVWTGPGVVWTGLNAFPPKIADKLLKCDAST